MKNYYNYKNQRGVALVELAIVLPMLLLLFIAFLAAIRVFTTYNAVGNIARVGTLWASSKIPVNGKNLDCSSIKSNSDYTSNSSITDYNDCVKLAVAKMNEVAKKYEGKLLDNEIHYDIDINDNDGVGPCFVTVEAWVKYKDPIFGQNVDFGMGAGFTSYNSEGDAKISFTAKAYRGEKCKSDE